MNRFFVLLIGAALVLALIICPLSLVSSINQSAPAEQQRGAPPGGIAYVNHSDDGGEIQNPEFVDKALSWAVAMFAVIFVGAGIYVLVETGNQR